MMMKMVVVTVLVKFHLFFSLLFYQYLEELRVLRYSLCVPSEF